MPVLIRVYVGLLECGMSSKVRDVLLGEEVFGIEVPGRQVILGELVARQLAVFVIVEVRDKLPGDFSIGIDSLADDMGGLGDHAVQALCMAHCDGHDYDDD